MSQPRIARGVKWARILQEKPPFIPRNGKPSAAYARGLVYERKALAMLSVYVSAKVASEPEKKLTLHLGPWLEFQDETGRRWCQPDAIVLSEGKGIIYEVKYQHCSEAWYQLWELYLPVLEVVFPHIRFACMEVVKWLDPHVAFPEEYRLTRDVFSVPDPSRTAVHIWNPSRD